MSLSNDPLFHIHQIKQRSHDGTLMDPLDLFNRLRCSDLHDDEYKDLLNRQYHIALDKNNRSWVYKAKHLTEIFRKSLYNWALKNLVYPNYHYRKEQDGSSNRDEKEINEAQFTSKHNVSQNQQESDLPFVKGRETPQQRRMEALYGFTQGSQVGSNNQAFQGSPLTGSYGTQSGDSVQCDVSNYTRIQDSTNDEIGHYRQDSDVSWSCDEAGSQQDKVEYLSDFQKHGNTNYQSSNMSWTFDKEGSLQDKMEYLSDSQEHGNTNYRSSNMPWTFDKEGSRQDKMEYLSDSQEHGNTNYRSSNMPWTSDKGGSLQAQVEHSSDIRELGNTNYRSSNMSWSNDRNKLRPNTTRMNQTMDSSHYPMENNTYNSYGGPGETYSHVSNQSIAGSSYDQLEKKGFVSNQRSERLNHPMSENIQNNYVTNSVFSEENILNLTHNYSMDQEGIQADGRNEIQSSCVSGSVGVDDIQDVQMDDVANFDADTTQSMSRVEKGLNQQQVMSIGQNVQQMMSIGQNQQQMMSIGQNQQQMMSNGQNVQQMMSNGQNQQQMMSNGQNQQQMMSIGQNQQQMMSIGQNQQQMMSNGQNVQQMMSNGQNQQQMMSNGQNQQQMMSIGQNQQQMMSNGQNVQQMMSNGQNQQQMMSNGQNQQQMMSIGQNQQQMMSNQPCLSNLQPMIQPNYMMQPMLPYLGHGVAVQQVKSNFVSHQPSANMPTQQSVAKPYMAYRITQASRSSNIPSLLDKNMQNFENELDDFNCGYQNDKGGNSGHHDFGGNSGHDFGDQNDLINNVNNRSFTEGMSIESDYLHYGNRKSVGNDFLPPRGMGSQQFIESQMYDEHLSNRRSSPYTERGRNFEERSGYNDESSNSRKSARSNKRKRIVKRVPGNGNSDRNSQNSSMLNKEGTLTIDILRGLSEDESSNVAKKRLRLPDPSGEDFYINWTEMSTDTKNKSGNSNRNKSVLTMERHKDISDKEIRSKNTVDQIKGRRHKTRIDIDMVDVTRQGHPKESDYLDSYKYGMSIGLDTRGNDYCSTGSERRRTSQGNNSKQTDRSGLNKRLNDKFEDSRRRNSHSGERRNNSSSNIDQENTIHRNRHKRSHDGTDSLKKKHARMDPEVKGGLEMSFGVKERIGSKVTNKHRENLSQRSSVSTSNSREGINQYVQGNSRTHRLGTTGTNTVVTNRNGDKRDVYSRPKESPRNIKGQEQISSDKTINSTATQPLKKKRRGPRVRRRKTLTTQSSAEVSLAKKENLSGHRTPADMAASKQLGSNCAHKARPGMKSVTSNDYKEKPGMQVAKKEDRKKTSNELFNEAMVQPNALTRGNRKSYKNEPYAPCRICGAINNHPIRHMDVHLPRILHDDMLQVNFLNPHVSHGIVTVLVHLKQKIMGKNKSFLQLRRFLDAKQPSPLSVHLVTQGYAEIMQQICIYEKWEIPKRFTIVPVNSNASLIHWRCLEACILLLNKMEREEFLSLSNCQNFQLFPQVTTGSLSSGVGKGQTDIKNSCQKNSEKSNKDKDSTENKSKSSLKSQNLTVSKSKEKEESGTVMKAKVVSDKTNKKRAEDETKKPASKESKNIKALNVSSSTVEKSSQNNSVKNTKDSIDKTLKNISGKTDKETCVKVDAEQEAKKKKDAKLDKVPIVMEMEIPVVTQPVQQPCDAYERKRKNKLGNVPIVVKLETLADINKTTHQSANSTLSTIKTETPDKSTQSASAKTTQQAPVHCEELAPANLKLDTKSTVAIEKNNKPENCLISGIAKQAESNESHLSLDWSGCESLKQDTVQDVVVIDLKLTTAPFEASKELQLDKKCTNLDITELSGSSNEVRQVSHLKQTEDPSNIKVPQVPDKVSDKVPQVTNKVSDKVPQVTDKVSDKVPQVTDKVSDKVPQVTDKVSDKVPQVTDKVSDKVPQVTDKVSEVPQVTDKVSDKVPQVTDKVSDKVPQVTDKVSEVPQVTDKVSDKVPQVTDKVSDKVPQVTDTVTCGTLSLTFSKSGDNDIEELQTMNVPENSCILKEDKSNTTGGQSQKSLPLPDAETQTTTSSMSNDDTADTKEPVNNPIRLIERCCDPASYPANLNSGTLYAIGVNPIHADSFTEEKMEQFERLLISKATKALGEVGLDWTTPEHMWVTQEIVLKQVLECCNARKALILTLKGQHGGCSPYTKALDIVQEFCGSNQFILLDDFHGDEEVIKSWLGKFRNCYFGFSQNVLSCTTEELLTLKNIPLDKIVLECGDSNSHKKGNEVKSSGHSVDELNDVAKVVADTMGICAEELINISNDNRCRLFHI